METLFALEKSCIGDEWYSLFSRRSPSCHISRATYSQWSRFLSTVLQSDHLLCTCANQSRLSESCSCVRAWTSSMGSLTTQRGLQKESRLKSLLLLQCNLSYV